MDPVVLEVNQRYLTKDLINPNEINILKSLCGTGKTTAMRDFLVDLPDETPIICMTFRKSLCSFLTGNLPNIKSYLECKVKYINCEENPRVAISPESFWRYKNTDGSVTVPRIYIIDEFCSFMEHLVNTTTLSGNQRNYFIEMSSLFFQAPDVTVILCDAYFSRMDYEIVEMLAGGTDRIHYVFNRYCEAKTKIILYDDATSWKKAFFNNAMNMECKLYVFSNCKKILEGLDQEYHEMKYPGANPLLKSNMVENDRRMLISSDSSNEEKEMYSSQPDESWSENRILYTTPTIQAGVSFMTEHFNKSFGYAISASTSVLAFLQQMARARNLSEKEIHLMLPKDMKKVPPGLKAQEINAENVRNNLVKYSQWTKARVDELIEKKLILEKGRIIQSPTNHSILNEILVRYLVNRSKQKISYANEFKKYIQNDWYELDYENPADQHGFTYMSSIMTTINASKTYKNKFWLDPSWDGEWDFEALEEGGIQSHFVDFANEWNLFGPLGRLDQLDKPYFNKDSLAKFVPKYVNKSAQKNFDDFFVRKYTDIMESDADEAKFDSYVFDTVLYSAMACVFNAYKMFPSNDKRILFPGTIQFEYRFIYTPASDVPMRILAEEQYMNDKPRFIILCKELDHSYCHVVKKLDLKMLSQVAPEWLVNRTLDSKALKDLRKILDAMLLYIGLKRVKKPILKVKRASFSKKKINFSTYKLSQFKKRIMISVCKMFRSSYLRVEHPNYPIVDPFGLLNWDKVPKRTVTVDDESREIVPSAPRVRILRDRNRVSITREVSELDRIYVDPDTHGLRFWPIKKSLMTAEWFNQMKTTWGSTIHQGSFMTTVDNVLDRFDYWNPKESPDLFQDPLPDFYTMLEYRMRSYAEKRPLRFLQDAPRKRLRMFEEPFVAVNGSGLP